MSAIRRALVASILAGVLGAAGCVEASSTEGPRQGGAENRLPLGESAPLGLPLEDYFVDFERYGHAVSLAVADCMHHEGFSFPIDPWDDTIELGATSSRLGYPLFSVRIAEVRGYRQPLDPRRGGDGFVGFEEMPLGFEEALDGCRDASNDSVPDFAGSGNKILRFDSESRKIAEEDSAVVDALRVWRSCVGADAIAKYGDVPELFRVGVLTAMDQEFYPDQPSTLHLEASGEEKKIAVVDARCRDSSGFDSAYFGAVQNAQRDIVLQHADTLRGVARDLDMVEAAVDRMVQEHS